MKNILRIVSFFLISRIIIFIVISERVLPYSNNQSRLDNPLLDPFIIFDSFNYAEIATNGYSEDRLTAFFPLFPILVRGLVLVGVDVYWAGFLLANIFLILSLFLLDKILRDRDFSGKVRNIILFTITFFPSSFYFSAFYTESLFLFLTLSSFYFWERNNRSLAYIIGGVASVTRIVGIIIPMAFFLERIISKKIDFRDILLSFLAGCFFISYPLFLFFTKGNPLIFLQVQEPYFGRKSTFPFYSLVQEFVWTLEKIKNLEVNISILIVIFHLILFLVFIFYCVNNYKIMRVKGTIRWSEVFFTFGVTLFPLSSILTYEHLKIATHGYMRYFLPIFPLFIFMGINFEKLLETFTGDLKKRILLYGIVTLWTFLFIFVLLVLRNKGFVA